jgi:RHS repeat-associated protein
VIRTPSRCRVPVAVLVAALVVTTLTVAPVASPHIAPAAAQEAPPVEAPAPPPPAEPAAGRAVMLVVDTSGSMSGTPLEQAQSALTASIDALRPGDRAGLRSYGGSCGDGGAVLVAPAADNRDELRTAVAGLSASGGTPTPEALEAAVADLPDDAPEKLVVLVSDGQSTCGDPCAVAEGIAAAEGVGFRAYTVGFNTTGQAEDELACIARVTGGAYFPASDTASLQEAIDAAIGGADTTTLPAAATFGTGNPASNAPVACAGDPVNCATGNFTLTLTDAAVGDRGPGMVWSRTYNALDATTVGALGHGWSSSYGASLEVEGDDGPVTVRQENGSVATFERSATGNGYEAPAWVLASLERDDDGGWTFTRRQREVLRFDADGRLTALADRNGETTTLAYDDAGALSAVTSASGRELAVEVDDEGRVVAVTGPLGRTTRYEYDVAGDLVAVTDPAGGVVRYAYDDEHRLTALTDPTGGTTTNTYDDAGRVVAQTDATGATTTWEYAGDAAASTTRIVAADGQVVEEAFRDRLLVSRTVAAGTPASATTTYTAAPGTLGVAVVTDPLGRTTSTEYDAAGNPTRIVLPDGGEVVNTWDDLGGLTSTTDPVGAVLERTYDERGNVLTETTPTAAGPSTTTYRRDDADHPGDVTELIDPEGRSTRFSWTDGGELASETDATGATTRFAHNEAGELTRRTDAAGRVVWIRRDELGRAVASKQPSCARSASTYDAAGRLTAVRDEAGGTTAYAYDEVGRPTTTTRADGTVWQTRYDAVGRVVEEVDPVGRSTTHAYDERGLPVRTTRAGGRSSVMEYDAAGQLVAVTDAAGRRTAMTYSPKGELTTIDYADATPDVSFTYDANGTRTAMTDGTGTSRYAHDPSGRLTSYTNGAGATVSYDYDRSGLLTTLGYPGGQQVEHRYDDAGRLAALTGPGGEHTFEYSPTSRLVRRTAPNGVVTTQRHDVDDLHVGTRIRAGSDTLLALGYRRDRRGLVSKEVAAGAGALPTATAYRYDDIGQLTAADSTSTLPDRYDYDDVGQLTSVGSHAAGRTLTWSPEGELQEQGARFGRRSTTTATYHHDAVGQRTAVETPGGDSATYGWDQAGNLSSYQGPRGGAGLPAVEDRVLGTGAVSGHRSGAPAPTVDASYRFDGDGLRAASVVDGAVTAFTYDPSTSTPRLLVEGTRLYVYGPDGTVLEQVDVGPDGTSTATQLHVDQLGSTRLLTDEAGAAVQRLDYTPYGQLRAPPRGHTILRTLLRQLRPTEPDPTTTILFAGGHRDAESGLYYLIHRSYDPRTGQFLSVDPMLQLSGSAYGYVGGNPLNGIDPNGLCWGPACWIQDNWRGIATGGVIVVGTGAAVVCTIATAGICGGVIATTVTVSAVGAGTGAAVYALEDTCHTAGGYLRNALLGAIPAPPVGRIGAAGIRAVRGVGAARGASPAASRTVRAAGLADDRLPGLPSTAPRPSGLGSTGRTTPADLTEQLAMTQVRAAPGGRVLPVTMTDARWPASAGWVKMSQRVNSVEVHYVRNTITGAVDDFKFVGGGR